MKIFAMKGEFLTFGNASEKKVCEHNFFTEG